MLSPLVVCACLDESSLEAVSSRYFDPKISGNDRLSLVAEQALPHADFEALASDSIYENDEIVTRISTIRKPEISGQQYGLVQIDSRKKTSGGTVCQQTRTSTFIKTDGKWRSLAAPRLSEQVEAQGAAGDYRAAISTAEKWLELDPFSISAYGNLLFAQQRSGWSSGSAEHRSADDVVRAITSINPEDHDAVHWIIFGPSSLEAKKAFFRRLPKNACGRASAVWNIAIAIEDPKRRVSFLEAEAGEEIDTMPVLVEAHRQLHDYSSVKRLLTSDHVEAMLADLGRKDGSFAATWAWRVGRAAMRAGALDAARAFATLGLNKDPTDQRLGELMRRLGNDELRDIKIKVSAHQRRALNGDTKVHIAIQNLSKIRLADPVIVVKPIRRSGEESDSFGRKLSGTIAPGGKVSEEATIWKIYGTFKEVNVEVIGMDYFDGDTRAGTLYRDDLLVAD